MLHLIPIKLLSAIGFALLPMIAQSAALTKDPKLVYLPLVFFAEREMVTSSMYLGLEERVYETSWPDFMSQKKTSADRLLIATIDAMRTGDYARLATVADKAVRREDSRRFEAYMKAATKLMRSMKVVSVDRSFELAREVIYSVKLRSKTRNFLSLFRFTKLKDASFAFQPYGRETPVSELLMLWSLSATEEPELVEPRPLEQWKQIGKITHVVRIAPSENASVTLRYSFRGVATQGNETSLAKTRVGEVLETFEQIKREWRTNSSPPYHSFSSASAAYLRQSIAAMSDQQRIHYAATFAQQRPIFVIDACPIFVMYAVSEERMLSIFYFVRTDANKLTIVNVGRVTPLDQIFNGDLFRRLVLEKKPFRSVRIASDSVVGD